MKYLYLLPFLSACLGLYDLLQVVTKAESAPQQAAGAAMAVGTAVIPYVLVRAVLLIKELDQRQEIIKLLGEKRG